MDHPLFTKRLPVTPPWFWLGLAVLWVIALSLRFWGLERFNTLVFDEVYFAEFGHNYLTHTSFFDAHPPLGKYLIAFGIWVKGYNPWGYRWMNALTGSFIPVIVAGLGVQLTRHHGFALLAGALAVLDGLLLVESRYGLINIYMLAFGLLAHWLMLLSVRQQGWKHWAILALAGLSFGSAAAVKWTGLGFLLGLYLFWIIGQFIRIRQQASGQQASGQQALKLAPEMPLEQLLQLTFAKLFIFIPVLGTALYSLLWIPHLRQSQPLPLIPFRLFALPKNIALPSISDLLPEPVINFIAMHQQMFDYHHRLAKEGASIHVYCSSLLDWPLMKRPVSYFYQLASSLQEGMPMTGPPLSINQAKYVYSVYATGNPPLWWSATAAIAIILSWALWRTILMLRQPQPLSQSGPRDNAQQPYLPLYLATAYTAQLLPWISIGRCAFLYHYMPAYLFSSLALAWLLTKGLQTPWKRLSPRTWIILTTCMINVLLSIGILVNVLPGLTPAFWKQPPLTLVLLFSLCLLSVISVGILTVGLGRNPRLLALVLLSLSMLGFLFWLPFYLGLPISPHEWQWRIWFPSWI
jgi:dolichyl-phosphate-mannose-protein mannosyltransferase